MRKKLDGVYCFNFILRYIEKKISWLVNVLFFFLINYLFIYSNLLSFDFCYLFVLVYFILSIMYDGFIIIDSVFLVIIVWVFIEMVNNILVFNRVERENFWLL